MVCIVYTQGSRQPLCPFFFVFCFLSFFLSITRHGSVLLGLFLVCSLVHLKNKIKKYKAFIRITKVNL
ncbi:hypothetical protein BDV38DRAFT_258702 [Aspergillus pseudotamarii]|uniref:Uncharacterized protein n=1 Tax=Aspergillus pseudotamarii TaxID=132259 RepID=A0A5N6SIN0_ASPPS|nr:uncharacterized protein BDV38DRAFT_258702 [Aspergillus pseudotamarii]KAE8133233.1 hypothetical protein BDV38DRAFT_258702 [Aspergillus pseudotamarii]